jgi:cytoskeletal protein CcmA (bactofilin family)
MFRSTDRTTSDEQRRGGLQPVTGLTREVATSSTALDTTVSSEQTVVAREDRIDGTVRGHRAVRVLGQVKGKIEAPIVTIEEGAKVTADVTADEVVVGGEYSGKMSCRQRLEVRPSGRLSGRIETVKMLLHEGGFIDGELHMIKPGEEETPAGRSGAGVRSGAADSSVRSGAADSTVRQAVGPGAEAVD